jgi:hypothetical protein
MSLHVSGVAQLDIYQLNLVLDILDVFGFEYFVFENKIFACLLEDLLDKSIKVIIIKLATQYVLVNFLAELHHFFKVFVCDVVLLRVSLSHHEHLVVLLPKGLEVGILLDDQVNDVQGG